MEGDTQLKDPLTPEQLVDMYEKIDYIYAMLKRFEPMLEKYERAAQAGSFMAQRKAMKGVGR